MVFDTEVLDSITGDVEHAKIIIEDKRQFNAQSPTGTGNQYIQMVQNQSVMNAAINNGITKSFKVQFNPSTLSLQAQSGKSHIKMTPKNNESSPEMIYNLVKDPPRIRMSVKLLFDAVNNTDSFMSEKFVLNPTSLGAQVVNAKIKKEFTVQPYVEGFMAALRNPSTREISFNWGDFIFKGKLVSMDSKYTMFSVSGQPVRAEISLSMVTEKTDIVRADYMNLSTADMTNMGKSIQQIGNLLNLPF